MFNNNNKNINTINNNNNSNRMTKTKAKIFIIYDLMLKLINLYNISINFKNQFIYKIIFPEGIIIFFKTYIILLHELQKKIENNKMNF